MFKVNRLTSEQQSVENCFNLICWLKINHDRLQATYKMTLFYQNTFNVHYRISANFFLIFIVLSFLCFFFYLHNLFRRFCFFLICKNIYNLCIRIHCVKNVQIRSIFWSVFSRIRTIQSECGKIRTRKYSVFGHFSRSDCLMSWKGTQGFISEGIEEITRTKPNVNNTSSLEKIYKWESQLTPKSISNFSSKTIRSHFALWNHYAAIVILSGKNLFRDLERRNWYAVTSVAITL